MQVDEINRQVDKLLKDNVIQESHSPWNAPVHLVPKKMDASGEIKFRMVIDYRRLNDITIDDKYPLPNITDLFDKLGKSSYFSTIDLASGYHQIEIEEQDRQKTAFSTQNGHYEFLRMPFGLKTAPATFQRTMDSVLRGLQGIHCMYPDFDKTFILTTDASNIALGAVLSQGPIGSDRPVAYASRTLSDTESRYSTIERELLAVIWAVKLFRPYLYGRKFVIYTDHRPLVWLYSLKEPNSKLTRWRLRLQEYDFEIIYKNGKQNTNADALSRIKVNALNSDDEGHSMDVNFDSKEYKLREHLKDVVKEIEKLNTQNKRHNDTTSIVTISDSSTVSASPMSLSDTISICSSEKVSEYPIRSPSESSKSQTVHSAVELESNGIPILHEAIDTKPNQILIFSWFKNEYQVKDTSRKKQKVLEVFLPLDNSELIKEFLKKYIRPKIKYFIYFERKEHRRQFSNIIIHLFKKDMVQFYECTERVIFVEDEKEQRAIVIKYHEGKTCHRGIKETLVRIRRNYYWDNLQETVSAIINSCTACKKMKYDRKPIKPILQLTQTQDAPFQEIFIDLFNIEGKHYLTLIDAFSKLGQAIEIANRSTPEVVRALMRYFSFYGIPKKISSDPGSEFNNELIKEFLSLHKIEQHIGTPNSPSSMGLIERFHSTIIEIYRLAKYERKPTDAASVMTYSVLAYNNTIHSVTELTPFEVVFGHTDTGSPFNTEFDKQYLQHLVRDHAKRTKFLYKYLAENMVAIKEKIRKKKGGEDEMVFQCEYIRDITVQKFQQLMPRRFKRGILNPLGSVLKIITGNLDHEDALKYDKLTSELSHNQIIISKKLTLVSKMLDSFINATETLNNNSVMLDARLKSVETMLNHLTTRENNWVFSTYIFGLFNLFISNFRTIFYKLSEIETALAFSRVSILHQSIVNSTELLDHLKLISNTENLVYPPTETNLVKLEQTISVKSYLKKNQIAFIMEIPLTDNNTYNYFKVYSVPIFRESVNETIAIFPKYPYLLVKGMKYLPVTKPCRPLAAGNDFLCTEENRALYPGLTCIEQLMKFENNLTCCTQHAITIEDVKVQRIKAENWIVFTKLKTTLTKHCGNEITKQPIFGTYILTSDEPCDLEIHGTYIHHHRVYTEYEAAPPVSVINLPHLRANINVTSTRVINMNGVNLDEVKYMSNALKHSEIYYTDLSALNGEKDSNFSVLTYVILNFLALSFLLFFIYVLRKKCIPYIQNYRKGIKNDITDNFALREGGVMDTPRPSVLD
ncbi:unnamed protein product [Parnassius mnemosyne]|uniref:RNA-directed DNA polymerase n=1 Tax=Parnassius mnemosyne TaxID=213953 RepID=A0AAV1KMF9_9NEOP